MFGKGKVETVELTITSDYVDWGIYEGIREVFQNGIDGDAKGFKMETSYENGTLTVTNRGAELPIKSLLIGYSTKRGDMTQIGQFGEGLKLSMPGLLKSGCKVTIYNQKTIWIPKLSHSRKFDQEVLSFEIHEAETMFPGLSFEIRGISEKDWEEAKKMFLIFVCEKMKAEKKLVEMYETPYGRVIFGMPGKIFVNGILIENIGDDRVMFGYDFKPGQIQVDRDRKMANRYTLKSIMGKCWVFLASQHDEKFGVFEDLLKTNAFDVEDLSYAWQVDAALKSKLASSFKATYGKDSLAVRKNEDVAKASFAGRHAYVFGEAYVKLLESEIGDIEKVKEEFSKKVENEVDPMDLNEVESANFFRSWRLVTSVMGTKTPEIRIVEFLDKARLGMFRQDEMGCQSVLIGRHILTDLKMTLETMVHEANHPHGQDGSKAFQDALENTWGLMVVKLLNRQVKQGEMVREPVVEA